MKYGVNVKFPYIPFFLHMGQKNFASVFAYRFQIFCPFNDGSHLLSSQHLHPSHLIHKKRVLSLNIFPQMAHLRIGSSDDVEGSTWSRAIDFWTDAADAPPSLQLFCHHGRCPPPTIYASCELISFNLQFGLDLRTKFF